MNEMDPDLKDLIQSVGMTEEEVKEDKEKVDFIYDFIAKSGGLDAVKKYVLLSYKSGTRGYPVLL